MPLSGSGRERSVAWQDSREVSLIAVTVRLSIIKQIMCPLPEKSQLCARNRFSRAACVDAVSVSFLETKTPRANDRNIVNGKKIYFSLIPQISLTRNLIHSSKRPGIRSWCLVCIYNDPEVLERGAAGQQETPSLIHVIHLKYARPDPKLWKGLGGNLIINHLHGNTLSALPP